MNSELDSLYNLNVEKSVLATFLADFVDFDMLDEMPSPDLFFSSAHRDIYDAVLFLFDNDKPITEEFVISRLVAQKKFDEAVFLDILSLMPLTNLKAYIDELEDLKIKRDLKKLTLNIKSKLAENETTQAIIDEIENTLLHFDQKDNRSSLSPILEAIEAAEAHIKKMEQKKNGLIGVDTGFTALNSYTGGFNDGELIILAARPSMGKTALALNMLFETAKSGNTSAFLSLEMPKEQIALRLMSIYSGISLHDIRTGSLNESQKQSLDEAKKVISSKPIFIDDTSVLNIRHIRSKIKRLKAKHHDLKLVFIDYLQLIDSSSNKDRHLQISEISRGLKLLARELGIAIVALSQLNRSLESRTDKRPMLSDLRESGAIEQDADIILFVYRDDVYRKNEEKQKEKEYREKGIDYTSNHKDADIVKAELIIGKQRNGPIGTVDLEFSRKNASFNEKRKTKETVFELN